MPEDVIRDGADKNYEEYIAELETELSVSKQSNAVLRERVRVQAGQIHELELDYEDAERGFQILAGREKTQDAITAWTMGFE